MQIFYNCKLGTEVIILPKSRITLLLFVPVFPNICTNVFCAVKVESLSFEAGFPAQRKKIPRRGFYVRQLARFFES
jgi:hypothetical protein